MIDKWISNKMVGVKTKEGICKIIQKVKKGGAIPKGWGAGRKSIITIDNMCKSVASFLGQNKGLRRFCWKAKRSSLSRELSQTVIELCYNKLPKLLITMQEKGHVTDAEFETALGGWIKSL